MNKIFFIYILHGLGSLIPLLEFPLLARKLGAANYGSLLLVQSSVLLVSLFIEYGFSISATRAIALVRDDKKKCRKLYGDVFSAKIILSIPVIIFFVILLFFMKIEAQTIFLGLLYLLAFAFSCSWYYQGLNRLVFSNFCDLVFRILSLMLIYFLLPQNASESDALIYMALCSFLSTLFTNGVVIYELNFFKFDLKNGLIELVNGFNAFLYKSSSNVVASGLPLVIGLVSGVRTVASVASSEKIIRALVGLLGPMFLIMYPYYVVNKNKKKQAFFLCTVISFFSLIVSFLIFNYSEFVLRFVAGESFSAFDELLKILSISIFLRTSAQAMVYFLLLPAVEDYFVAKMSIIYSLAVIILIIPLTLYFGAIGSVVLLVIADGVVLFAYLCKFFRMKK